MKRAFIFLVVLLSLAVLTSCQKDDIDDIDTINNMEEITVPANFDWKTTRDIQITFTSNTNGIVEVLNSQNVPYQKVFLNPTQSYIMKLTLPSFETEIKLRFLGKESVVELGNGIIQYHFN
ncbi:MAG TPA: hypothetical protein VLH16_05210 [Bacteroidales bacterium]|nr:hypothetical protein [Bacteroidales bacterium]